MSTFSQICVVAVWGITSLLAEGPCHDKHAQYLQDQALGMVGASVPRCQDDGSFSNMQCSGSGCMCVLANGTSIPDTFVNYGVADMTNRDCNCARKVAEMTSVPMLLGFEARCDSLGNYESIQCQGSKCFCADAMGNQVSHDLMVDRWLQESLVCP